MRLPINKDNKSGKMQAPEYPCLNRRDFLRLLAASGAAAALPSWFSGCSADRKPPNILLFLSDDLGYGDLACYGNPINRTPHIDRLAAEGTRFTDFHAGGTVCSPSRASLLTGRHPYRSGFYYILGGGAHLRREEVTLPSLLKTAGYETCFAGKWHLTAFDNPEANQPSPSDHGFDHWFATVLNAFDGPENPGKFWRNGRPVGETKGWYCDLIVDEAISWLQNRSASESPFFLEVCSHEPHTPIAPPEKFSAPFDTPEVEKLEDTIAYGRVPRLDDKDIEPNKKQYYGTVAQLDAAFGRLMKALEDLGLREDTLVIFTSDNGPEYPVNFMESGGRWDDPIRDNCFGTPGALRGMKRFTYEGGHRVPGIVRWPGRVPAGAVSGSLINGTDLLPTLCGLTGASLPSDRTIDGEDVFAAWQGKPFERSRPIIWNFPVREFGFIPPLAYREKEWLLIAYFNDKPADQLWMDWIKTCRPMSYELYDLSKDIGQENDLSESLPGKVEELAARLAPVWKSIQDEAPVWPQVKAK